MFAFMLLPLDMLRPDEILARYQHWFYFALLLTLFISISGVALRKHFDKPYVKPLIVSVGGLMTVAMFSFRNHLAAVFEGWGVLGGLLLAFIAAMIPYGLCRGFGVSKTKAFYFSYILAFILAWLRFPFVFQAINNHNLGILNLVFFVLFIIAIWKLIPFKSSNKEIVKQLGKTDYQESQTIINEAQQEAIVETAINKYDIKLNQTELNTLEDMQNVLKHMIASIKQHKSGLTQDDRQEMAHDLMELLKLEKIYQDQFIKFDKMFKIITVKDEAELQNIKMQASKASKAQKQLINKEIKLEREKQVIRSTVNDLKGALLYNWRDFDALIRSAAIGLRDNPNPVPAGRLLYKAHKDLSAMSSTIETLRDLGKRLAHLVKVEKTILKQ